MDYYSILQIEEDAAQDEIKRAYHITSCGEIFHGNGCHVQDFVFGLLNGNGGRFEQVFFGVVQMRLFFGLFILFIGNKFGNKFYQRIGERQNKQNSDYVENRMEHGELNLRGVREHFSKQPTVVYIAEMQE